MAKARVPQQITLPEGATLRELVERGVAQSQAAVCCLVRLREELSLVQEVPVLFVIDEVGIRSLIIPLKPYKPMCF